MKNLKFLLIGILVFQFLNTGITQNSNQTSKTKMNKYKELKGDDLVGEVFVDISQEVWYGKEKNKNFISTMALQKKVIYKTYALEMAVNNGGFFQVLYDKGDEFLLDLPECLKAIGANKHAEIVEKAIKLIKENEKYINRAGEYIDSFDEKFATEALNTLDNEFYNHSEIDNILKLQAKYITENISAFD
jgi:hypothetical protein